MRVLFLSEGDAESMVGSFSGTAKLILDHLRSADDSVVTGNCDRTGTARAVAALPLVSVDRRRWSARYHLAEWPSRLRTRKARAHYDRLKGAVDVIFQIGATFRPPGAGRVP